MAFPDDPNDLVVEAEFGADISVSPAALTYPDDLSDYTRPYVTITRGRIAGAPLSTPTTIDLQLRNPSGIFSPRNVTGPHYGNLRAQTPIRTALDAGSGMDVRGTAYVPDWPTESSGPGIDDRVPIRAAGIMERLSIGQESKSALKRTILSAAGTRPVAYWTFEDGPEATRALPAGGGGAISYTTLIVPGSGEAPPGASGSMSISSTVDDVASTVLLLPFSSAVTGEIVMDLWFRAPVPTDDLNAEVDIIARDPNDPSYVLYCFMTNVAGTGNIEVGAPGAFANASIDVFDGAWHNIRLVAVQSTSVDIELFVDGVSSATTSSATALPLIISAEVQVSAFSGSPAGQTLTCGVCHFVVYDDASAASLYEAGLGYPGEEAAVRFARLCGEEGLDHDVAAGASQAMGPQLPGTVLDLLRECEFADEGVMVERRTGELGFDPVVTRYNQTAAMTIPYESLEDLLPDNSVRDAVNRATVTRIGGSSATYEQTTGPRGSSRATGIGPYPTDINRSLEADTDIADHASWLVNIGTVDEPRFVAVLNLTHNPTLIDAWLACDIGSRIVINPPATGHESADAFAERFGPDPLDLILEGYEETPDAIDWTLVLYLEPYSPYFIFTLDDPVLGRLQTRGSELALSIDATETSLLVATLANYRPWINGTDHASQFSSFYVQLGGEIVQVTDIDEAESPQTFTVVRSVNGVVKSHPAGTPVRVARVGV